ncbi:MAG: DUF116 domain-containing protein [Anaerolineales bacterium]|nr:DUF116 domain-containing protein [Anaerolineales bacterium]
MTDRLTYSLRLEAHNSNSYYTTIAALADQWLVYAQRVAGSLIYDFQRFRRTAGLPEHTLAEDAFELLVLGVLLREHGQEAAELPPWAAQLLAGLVALQDRWPWAEGAIKAARGFIGGLIPHKERKDVAPLKNNQGAMVGNRGVASLLRWLRAYGQATRADRLAAWQNYLKTLGPESAQMVISQSLALADHFAREGEAVLGRYTTGVESFRTAVKPQLRFRYDSELVLRSRLEYHLGMLGTELLNRAYRARFLATPYKMVIVPPCLRARPDTGPAEGRCQALQTTLGAKCQGCQPDCRVHQLTKLGEKAGFAVYSIPDDELQKVCLASGKAGGSIGVVGLSCALTNWSAGWEADRLGLPAQGLLLDYVGCRQHWCRQGCPTDTNFNKLQELIG